MSCIITRLLVAIRASSVFGSSGRPRRWKHVAERAPVVEADQLAVILVFGDLDALRLEHLVEGVKV
jgi:hypothetical protein